MAESTYTLCHKQKFHLAGDFMKTPPLRRGRSHALKQIDFQLSEFVFAQKTSSERRQKRIVKIYNFNS